MPPKSWEMSFAASEVIAVMALVAISVVLFLNSVFSRAKAVPLGASLLIAPYLRITMTSWCENPAATSRAFF